MLVAGCGFLFACSPETHDPETLPFTLEPVLELGKHVQAVDLDGDGVDEIVKRNWGEIHRQGSAILLTRLDGGVIEQVNFAGELPVPLHFLDYDGDGALEILVPLVRNDSLFVSFVGVGGRKLFDFFLVGGEPRREDGSVLAWDPQVESFYVEDLDGDGRDELVTVIQTAYARLPRGVLVHRLPDGQPLGAAVVGSYPSQTFFGDFDGDGGFEVVAQGVATNNGARAGGLDDRHSYLIVFDLGPAPAVEWVREMGDQWTEAHLAYEDFDGDGQREFLSFTSNNSSRPSEARLEIIEPGTWHTAKQRAFAEPLQWPQVIDLDRDAQPEIIALQSPGEVWAFDRRFEVVRRRRVAPTLERLETLPDLDGDGIDEIVALTTNARILMLDAALKVKAVYEPARSAGAPSRVIAGVLHRGIGRTPYLLVQQGGQVVAMELVANRWWWLYRYGPLAGWVLGVAAALGIGVGGRSLYRRTRLAERIYPAAVDAAANGVLVLDPEQRIVLMNATLREWVGVAAGRTVSGEPMAGVLSEAPDLVAFLRRALAADPPRHYAEDVGLGADGQDLHYTGADPVFLVAGRAPYWLVALSPGRHDAVYLDAGLWAAMAHEVTHKLKNALGTILLEAEDLQVAYRAQFPAVAPTLDAHTERIVDHVDTLRRETLQLMSVFDAEALTLTRSDLSIVVRDVAEALLRSLPSRADLRFHLAAGLPGVLIDRGQVQAALENLVTNAARAVRAGGAVTVSTLSVSDLLSPYNGHNPTDYVVLEVRDNGVGIARADLRRIFEPGFTTAEFGTGLGLALVHRIATQHGGFVEVESEAGLGSIFSLYFPVTDGESARPHG